jgi:hypothetical protein
VRPKNPGERSCCPGYGWVFGVGDGTSNLGLGILNTSKAFGNVDYKDVMRRWVATMPEEWTYHDETMVGPIRGAGLPMGSTASRTTPTGCSSSATPAAWSTLQRRGHRVCDGVRTARGGRRRAGLRAPDDAGVNGSFRPTHAS